MRNIHQRLLEEQIIRINQRHAWQGIHVVESVLTVIVQIKIIRINQHLVCLAIHVVESVLYVNVQTTEETNNRKVQLSLTICIWELMFKMF